MTTRTLRELQEAFADAVLGGEAGTLAQQLDPAGADAMQCIGIYRRSVQANLVRALRSAFPVVRRLVGDAFFDEAARQHAVARPPVCADLNRYGDGFSSFLEGYPHAAALPWLADVARLEWAVHEASMAADGEPPDYAALACLPAAEQAELRFALRPSVRVVRSAYPILAVWEANQADRDGTPGRTEGEDRVLVWRDAGLVRAAPMTPREADFVDSLGAGQSLGDAVGTPDWDAAACLQRLARESVLGPFRRP